MASIISRSRSLELALREPKKRSTLGIGRAAPKALWALATQGGERPQGQHARENYHAPFGKRGDGRDPAAKVGATLVDDGTVGRHAVVRPTRRR